MDIDAYGLFGVHTMPDVKADAHCSDSTGSVPASLDTATTTHSHHEHLRRGRGRARCAVHAHSVTPIVTSPAPQVNGQLSCDGNTTVAVGPGATVAYSMSTKDVSGSAPVDFLTNAWNYDTDTLICQAWGPLDTSVPIAPWKVECAEP